MSYKDVLKIFKLERELSDDESALLNTLREMSDTDRELLAETLGPPVKGKVGKTAATRKIEHCEICDYTRRAVHHKDIGHKDYHEFQPSFDGPRKLKSARASSLAEKIAGTARGTETVLCTYELNGKVCKGLEDDAIHDKSMGYGGYHPFVSSSSVRPAVGQSSTSGSEVSSEIDSEDVSSVARG